MSLDDRHENWTDHGVPPHLSAGQERLNRFMNYAIAVASVVLFALFAYLSLLPTHG